MPVAYHEVGHCLDYMNLSFNHNGFSGEGAMYGAYYAPPEEGYAQSYMAATLLSCGADLAAVRWPGAPRRRGSLSCLPRPETVTPAAPARLLAARRQLEILERLDQTLVRGEAPVPALELLAGAARLP